ncbi:MAG: hypothetical protein DWQ11_07135 [Proteobacteria bacterium]|nr:MAG: hypothetical protein DWQ11_07135 [Pseudomonadota bacterium]
MDEALDWFWGVLQGDFNDDPSLSQTIVSGIITAIPIIDQIADVRDVIANLHQLSKDSTDTWKWVALAITLIGLIPVLGSVLKGVFKILIQFVRKGGEHADEALEMILAVVRGAGKGDPVKWLKSLPMDDYARQALKHFNEIADKLKLGLSDVRHMWLAKAVFGEKLKRLELVERQIDKLKALGQSKIPEAMRFLKKELDELLSRAKPARLDGSADTANTLAHSAKPLLRLEYEVVVKRRVGGLVDGMRKAGKSDEEIARAASLERRRIGQDFKDKTDPDLRKIIYQRNQNTYGDPLGPTYEDLKRGYVTHPQTRRRVAIGRGSPKSDVQIIEGAQQAGGDDFPWDKIMEYYREKKTGDPGRAAELLQKIDAIVNKAR